MRNVNCPRTKVFVRCDAFGGSAECYEPAWLISVRAMRGRPFCFQVWVDKYAACFDKIPPHCIYWFEPSGKEKPLPLHIVQMWECLSGSIEVWRKDQLSNAPVLINLGNGMKPMNGHYWFTIDFIPEGQAHGIFDVGEAELLEEHKEGNVIKLSNGQIVIYPNNRLKWLPPSLTNDNAAAMIPDWEVASNSQWDKWGCDSGETLGDSKWAY